MACRTPSYGETCADDYYMTDDCSDFVGSVAGEGFQHWYLWEKYFTKATNDWGLAYQPVYNAEPGIGHLKKIPRTSPDSRKWDNIKGPFYAAGALFLSLLWNYSKAYDSTSAEKDLGIALRLTSDFNVRSVRASNRECYLQVLKDTKAAASLLPEYAQIKCARQKLLHTGCWRDAPIDERLCQCVALCRFLFAIGKSANELQWRCRYQQCKNHFQRI